MSTSNGNGILHQGPGGISNYDQTFLECRDMLHAWYVVGHYQANGHIERLLECRRGCSVQGIDTLNRHGRRVKARKYQYPDGYQVEGGIDKEDVRAERLRRVKVYASEQTMQQALARATATKRPSSKKRHRNGQLQAASSQ